MPGVVTAQRARCALGDDAPVVDEDDLVSGIGLLHVVRGEEDRDAELAAQFPQGAPHEVARLGIEPRRRLIEEEHLRVPQERAGDVHAAPLPAAESPVGAIEDLRQLEDLLEALEIRAAAPVEACPRQEVGPHAQLPVEQRVLEDDSQAVLDIRPVLYHVHRPAIRMDVGHGAGRGPQERGEHGDRRGLPRSIGTEEREQ